MFAFALTFLISVIISFKLSTNSSSSSNSNVAFAFGHSATIKSSVSKHINFEYISEVTNGINGCNSFNDALNT